MYKRLHVKQPSCHILKELESSRQIFEYTQTPNIMKIRLVGEELSLAEGIQTDGRTYMMKSIVAFRNFAKVPKMKLRVVYFSPTPHWVRTFPSNILNISLFEILT